MGDPHAFRFILGVICILVLTLCSLVLPSARYPLLLLVVVGLVGTWREYLHWRRPVRP